MAYKVKKDPIDKIPKAQFVFGLLCVFPCSFVPDTHSFTAIW